MADHAAGSEELHLGCLDWSHFDPYHRRADAISILPSAADGDSSGGAFGVTDTGSNAADDKNPSSIAVSEKRFVD